MKALSNACAQLGVVTLSEDLSTAFACLRDRVLKGAPRLVHAMHRNKSLLFADVYHDEGGAGVGGYCMVPPFC